VSVSNAYAADYLTLADGSPPALALAPLLTISAPWKHALDIGELLEPRVNRDDGRDLIRRKPPHAIVQLLQPVAARLRANSDRQPRLGDLAAAHDAPPTVVVRWTRGFPIASYIYHSDLFFPFL
jgi:hypothetical protein